MKRTPEERKRFDEETARLLMSWPAGYTVTGDRKPGSGIRGFISDTLWTVTAPSGEVVGSCIVDTDRDVRMMFAREVHEHAAARRRSGAWAVIEYQFDQSRVVGVFPSERIAYRVKGEMLRSWINKNRSVFDGEMDKVRERRKVNPRQWTTTFLLDVMPSLEVEVVEFHDSVPGSDWIAARIGPAVYPDRSRSSW